jgi:hypothetical protein
MCPAVHRVERASNESEILLEWLQGVAQAGYMGNCGSGTGMTLSADKAGAVVLPGNGNFVSAKHKFIWKRTPKTAGSWIVCSTNEYLIDTYLTQAIALSNTLGASLMRNLWMT